MNCSGFVFWGFAIPEDAELPWGCDEFEVWQDYFCHVRQVELPLSSDDKDQHEWYERKQRVIQESGCEIDYPGHHEDTEPQIIVHVSEAGIYSTVPQLEPLDVEQLIVKPDWENKLRAFCEDMGIPFGQPGWFLTSFFG